MGLLDGDIQALFGQVFGAIYLDGTLHRTTVTKATNGDLSSIDADFDIKAQFEEVTETMLAAGFTDGDVAIIILQSGVSPAITTDDQVTVGGVRYRVAGIHETDPAGAYWLIKGQEA